MRSGQLVAGGASSTVGIHLVRSVVVGESLL
jgi:hypothetical protein